MNPQEIQNAATVMREAWSLVHGRAPSEGELLYSLLVAKHESSFGRGWKGAMAGSNNWGAVQCGQAAIAQGAACISWQDTHPDGRKYDVGFRKYASPVEGAADVVRNLTKQRPSAWEVMKAKGPLSDFARAMRVERYYGGFCPEATKAGGRFSYGKPKSKAEEACHEEAIAEYVKANRKSLSEIAGAIGIAAPPVESPKGLVASSAGAWWPWALAAAAGVGLAVAWRRA